MWTQWPCPGSLGGRKGHVEAPELLYVRHISHLRAFRLHTSFSQVRKAVSIPFNSRAAWLGFHCFISTGKPLPGAGAEPAVTPTLLEAEAAHEEHVLFRALQQSVEGGGWPLTGLCTQEKQIKVKSL